jgi:formamidopyrimidine-DNA glycosylase
MPELPEVETVKRGIAPHLIGKTFIEVIIRFPRLRWPIPPNLTEILAGQRILSVWRRAKYLIIEVPQGALLIHLGMSGSLRILTYKQPPEKHDHVDLILDDDSLLRLRDPRRFGALLWQPGPALLHRLLSRLGPEPLEAEFNAEYLSEQLKNKDTAIKIALMDNHLVVGVGNIYANEALFRAGILPQRTAKTLNKAEIVRLVDEIKTTLLASIAAGGSTLKDFVDSAGKAGYFQQSYFVYQRSDTACHHCGGLIGHQVMGGRATFFCRICQK